MQLAALWPHERRSTTPLSVTRTAGTWVTASVDKTVRTWSSWPQQPILLAY